MGLSRNALSHRDEAAVTITTSLELSVSKEMVSLREADEFIDHCENDRPQNLEGQEYECKEKWSIYK